MFVERGGTDHIGQIHRLLAADTYACLADQDKHELGDDSAVAYLLWEEIREGMERSTVLISRHKEQVTGCGLMFTWEHPLGGTKEAIVWGFAGARTDRGTGAGALLLSALEGEALAHRCAAMYVELLNNNRTAVALFGNHGWEPTGVRVRKALPNTRKSPPSHFPGIQVREASESDGEFVRTCIADAMWHGLGADEQTGIARAEIRHLVQQDYGQLLRAERYCLVAELAGEVVAHSTYQLNALHRPVGWQEAELVDTYVLEPYRSRGISTALSEVAEAALARSGFRRLNGSVSFARASGSHTVVQRLEQSGWWVNKIIMRKCLREASAG